MLPTARTRVHPIRQAELCAEYLNRCAYCGEPAKVLDHVVPLSSGGSNDEENLVPCCNRCNSSKNRRSLLGWIVEGRLKGW